MRLPLRFTGPIEAEKCRPFPNAWSSELNGPASLEKPTLVVVKQWVRLESARIAAVGEPREVVRRL